MLAFRDRSLLIEYGLAAVVWSGLVLALLLRGVEVMDATGFMARRHCGEWDLVAMNLYITSNLMTTLAYFAIGACLTVNTGSPTRQLTDTEHAAMRFTFALFIVACAIGHLDNVFAFWWPAYHLFTLAHAATALVSWVAFFRIFRHRLTALSVL